MAGKRKISLVLADVDGTLVTEEKILTERARDAVKALRRAGILFAITSGRPPLGMAMLFDALDIETPIAGFNGSFLSIAISPSWSEKGVIQRCGRGNRSDARTRARYLGV